MDSATTEKGGNNMDEILNDPLRFWMLIFLVATEIPAIIFLIVMWKKACKEAKEKDTED